MPTTAQTKAVLMEQSAASFVNSLLSFSPLALWDAGVGVYSDAGITPAVDAGSVQQWNDQSGNGYHLSQTTAAAKPTWNSQVAALNNRPAVSFDGGDYLTRSVAGLVANLNVYNLFAVYTTTTTGVITIYGEGNTGNGTPLIELDKYSSNSLRYLKRDDASATANIIGGASSDDGNAHLITLRRLTASSWALRLDGAQVQVIGTSVGTLTVNTVSLGALVRTTVTNHFTGNIAFVGLYNTQVYETVEPLLAAWYGVSL